MTQNSPESPRARYWRSLDELQRAPEFDQFLHREFPVAASEYPEGVSRRRWIQLMGASLSLSGVAGCRYSEELIAPFVVRPEGRVPGELYEFATNIEWADRVYHLLVRGVDGRPIKVEGLPKHPTSRGGTDVYAQASTLSLYDPDRMEGAVARKAGKSTELLRIDLRKQLNSIGTTAKTEGGRTVGVLIGPTHSPSVVSLLKEMREAYPQMTLCRYDSVRGDVMRQATQQALGRVAEPLLELDQAKVIVSIGADLLGQDRHMVRNANRFAAGREPEVGRMSRLYVFESGFSNTGMSADTRVALRPQDLIGLLAELEKRIDAGAKVVEGADGEAAFDDLKGEEKLARVLEVLAGELADKPGKSVIVVGEHLGAEAVAAGIRLNSKLGNLGKTIQFAAPVDSDLGEVVDLDTFAGKLGSELTNVVLLAPNPVVTAPGNVDLAGAITRVAKSGNVIYLADYDDETAQHCTLIAAAAHPLESWSDVISADGFYGVSQPQILPLLGGITRQELLADFLGRGISDGQAIVRESAGAIAGAPLDEKSWRRLLHEGFSEDLKIAIPPAELVAQGDALNAGAPSLPSEEIDQDNIDVWFVPADGVYDGRFANNGWLQEMPQSITKLTWDNAAVMSPLTAEKLGVRQGVMVALRIDEQRAVELPVYVMPGAAHGVVTVAFGYGRTRAGAVGGHVDKDAEVIGADVRVLRTSDRMMWAKKMEARPRAAAAYTLANTQDHFAIDPGGMTESMERAERLVREGTLEQFEKNRDFAQHMGEHAPNLKSLWQEPMRDEVRAEVPNQWGMAIDLTKCIGCNACVVACQAENNVPIVGREQVKRGREMHWLRLDRYFVGTQDDPQMVSEPVACMHCETAPCEQVCPVAATVHSDEGLNTMAYNRCIGTRYCGNNCPYKVRRFNYFNYQQPYGYGYGINAFPDSMEKANRKLQALVLNPEVSVRGRGVMEKCTYCIQRIEHGKIEARKDGGRPIRDGEIQSACQTACPTQAIVFGNIRDPDSKVLSLHKDPRAYGMLDHLNVKPRTLYLARIRNPHPRLMTSHQVAALHADAHGHGGHGEHHEEAHGDAAHGHDDHKHDDKDSESHGKESAVESKTSSASK